MKSQLGLVSRSAKSPPWIEIILAACIGAGLIFDFWYLDKYGYLPQPFFYSPIDTWSDWFNPAIYAHNRGTYDYYGTVYPPLSFVMLKIFSLARCYPDAEAYSARDCDWLSVVSFHAQYVLAIVLTAKFMLRIDRRTALPRAFAMTAGMPMLFALERANLLIASYICVLLAFGPLLKHARSRWLAFGLAINFKVYLISALFAQLIKRRWRWFEGALVASIIVYIITYAILQRGTLTELLNNIVYYSDPDRQIVVLDLWYPISLQPLLALLKSNYVPAYEELGSRAIEIATIGVALVIRAAQAIVGLAAVLACLRPEVVPPYRATLLGIGFALISTETGGYTVLFLLPFVFSEPWKGFGRKLAIVTGYILCLHSDIPLGSLPPLYMPSFLRGGSYVHVQYYVGLSSFIRPLLVITMMTSLASVTIASVWRDIRVQGWRTRWRFRNDLPLLTGPGEAIAPSANAAARG